MKCLLVLFLLTLISCAERKAVPPQSNAGDMPWGARDRGEGSSQFGGMLERR